MSVLTDMMTIKVELQARGYKVFSEVLNSLNIIVTDEIPTMGVSANNEFVVNEKFFNSLNKKQKTFTILHEIMHVVLKHCHRHKDKDPIRMNIANDVIVNELLLSGSVVDTSIIEKVKEGCFFDNTVLEDVPGYNKILNDEYNLGLTENKYDNYLKAMYLNFSTGNTIYTFLENKDKKELLKMFKDILNNLDSNDSDSNDSDSDSNNSNDNSTNNDNESNDSDNVTDENTDSNKSDSNTSKSKSGMSGKSSKTNKSNKASKSNNSDKTDSNDSTTQETESSIEISTESKCDSKCSKNASKQLSDSDIDLMNDEEVKEALNKVMKAIGGTENNDIDKEESDDDFNSNLENSLTESTVKKAIENNKGDKSFDSVVNNTKQQIEKKMKKFSCGKGTVEPQLYELSKIKSADKIDWVKLVKTTVLKNVSIEREYSYATPNRRMYPLQRLTQNKVCLANNSINKSTPVVHFFVDTSGSVGDYELYCVLNEINEVFKVLKNIEIEIFFFDGELNPESIKVKAGKSFKLKAQKLSRGGTEFKNIWLRYFNKDGKPLSSVKQPDVCVIITDGCCYGDYTLGGKIIGKKTIWVTDTKDWQAPNPKMKVVYRKFS